ncbi:hypothetical protein [Stenotrophomonas sp.]|uniref:hypothetical protein n=1 Tax=Stenotrophomonas sp. TaxID=69392 RepID=UPI0028A198DD|nr:hypothetical protein [Stenotrophomonas sp.]
MHWIPVEQHELHAAADWAGMSANRSESGIIVPGINHVAAVAVRHHEEQGGID